MFLKTKRRLRENNRAKFDKNRLTENDTNKKKRELSGNKYCLENTHVIALGSYLDRLKLLKLDVVQRFFKKIFTFTPLRETEGVTLGVQERMLLNSLDISGIEKQMQIVSFLMEYGISLKELMVLVILAVVERDMEFISFIFKKREKYLGYQNEKKRINYLKNKKNDIFNKILQEKELLLKFFYN